MSKIKEVNRNVCATCLQLNPEAVGNCRITRRNVVDKGGQKSCSDFSAEQGLSTFKGYNPWEAPTTSQKWPFPVPESGYRL